MTVRFLPKIIVKMIANNKVERLDSGYGNRIAL
jgi:hypothetical protein